MDRHRLACLAVVLFVACAGCLGGVQLPGNDDADSGPEPGEATPQGINGSLEIHTIDVGQGDATLVIAPSGETMLIDSGDWRNDGRTVIDYLDARGVDRLDHLVTTHGHADHIGGHAAVIEYYETERDGVGAVWDPGVVHDSATYDRYLAAVEDHDVTLYATQDGDEIPIDHEAVQATVLHPAADPERPDDLDHNSVVLLFEFGETSALFTGDAGADAEERLLDAHADALDVDVYQAGHHGSSTSSTPAFLDALDPQATIISSAYDSQYGHPHEEPLEAFAERDVAAYWTGVHGTVVLESDGEAWTVATQADATTDPLALREEPEAEADPADAPDDHEPLAVLQSGPALHDSHFPFPPSVSGVVA